MTPFSWGARRGLVTERTGPTLRNQGWGTRKIVSVERAEGRMEALRGSLRQTPFGKLRAGRAGSTGRRYERSKTTGPIMIQELLVAR